MQIYASSKLSACVCLIIICNYQNKQFYMQTNRAVPTQGKVPYYRSDGTGRDTYIRDHNGGLLSHDRIHLLKLPQPMPQRKFNFSKNSYGRHPFTYKQGKSNKFPHYISDGSGRDFYVKDTEGGNSIPHRWRNFTDYKFKTTLRAGQSKNKINPETLDIYMQTQLGSLSQSQFNKTYSDYQKNHDRKLSQPKKALKPPSIDTYFGKTYNKNRSERICEFGIPHQRHTFYK